MPYFSPVIAIMNRVACSCFLLLSIGSFPPLPVPRFHHQLLPRCSLRDTQHVGFIICCFSCAGTRGNRFLSSHPRAPTQRDLSFCSAATQGEWPGRRGGWHTGGDTQWATGAPFAVSPGRAQLSSFPELASVCVVWKGSTSHSL